MMPSAELLQRLQTLHPNLEKNMDGDNDTSRTWRVPGYAGSVGFISSMSDQFCGTCNRLRVTADGQIKVCTRSTCQFRAVTLNRVLRSACSTPRKSLCVT